MYVNAREEKQRELRNALAGIQNITYAVIHGQDSAESKINALKIIQNAIPGIIRYLIYLDNTK